MKNLFTLIVFHQVRRFTLVKIYKSSLWWQICIIGSMRCISSLRSWKIPSFSFFPRYIRVSICFFSTGRRIFSSSDCCFLASFTTPHSPCTIFEEVQLLLPCMLWPQWLSLIFTLIIRRRLFRAKSHLRPTQEYLSYLRPNFLLLGISHSQAPYISTHYCLHVVSCRLQHKKQVPCLTTLSTDTAYQRFHPLFLSTFAWSLFKSPRCTSMLRGMQVSMHHWALL